MLLQRNKRAQRSEARPVVTGLLDNVLASLGDALILTDADDRIVLFNQAAQELTGFSESSVRSRSCGEVFPNNPALGSMIQRMRVSGQSQSCGEERLIVGRRQIPVRISCSPVYDNGSHLEGCALVIQDLSYQKKLESEARRNETLARLGGLVAGLAHEVKNPLGGIRGAAQLLAQRFGEQAEITEFTGVMIREIDRLSRLVEQLLTLGSPPTPDPLPVNVHKIIHEVVAILGSELTLKKATVRLQIDPSLPDTRGDEAQLTHVFLNLVKNALEAMPEGGSLIITTRMETDFHIMRQAGSGKFLRVEVADSGPGFPEDVLDRVFEPFFTTKARGSGLGLAICERIVAAHGGVIHAENRPSGGALVSVNLPLIA
ncbi:MAG: PAS domain-containing protein [Deltaproteobacteria bacterium]|nr:PAS domain-containing protein [Deltaproteobacteria bacterium]